MKNLKILMFGILLVSMQLTSCKKDADQQFQNAGNQQAQQDARAINKEKLFERSIRIYNADKTTSTTLRFRAASKELLDQVPLDNTEFTLVKAPESAQEAKGVDAATLSDNKGYSEYSGMNANQAQNTNETQVLPKNGIMIDLPSELKTKTFSIEVKSKNLNNSAKDQAAAAYLFATFWWKSGNSNIKVTNLAFNNPIKVNFYKLVAPNWIFSGFSFTLNQYGWARYWWCGHQVGAYVYYNPGWWYRITYYASCP